MNSMKMYELGNNTVIENADIDLDATFNCGQCFRWEKNNEGWTGVADGKAVTVFNRGKDIVFLDTCMKDVESFWIRYLDLEHDYSEISAPFSDDPYLCAAAEYGRGIHILHQDPLETVVSFIISANNNIDRIKKIINAFCRIYGTPFTYRGQTFYSFPTSSQLASVTVEDIQTIRAGFRDKYIYDASQRISSGVTDLSALARMATKDARRELMKIKGIGPKVADCVLLFGFARYEVFPKDVWIKRIIAEVYGDGFNETRFGANAGIIQQYLFHYARNFNK